jgi:hypothetical protein
MGRPRYVCTICSEHFTRKYSAIRHNGAGEIVILVEYLVGRKSGLYQASHPFWYRRNGKRIHKFGRATVEDYVGDTFPYRGLQRQQQGQNQYHQQSLEEQERYHQEQQRSQSRSIPPPQAAIQDQPPDVLPYPTNRPFQSQSMNTTDDEETTTLSLETRLKIEELKRLIYRYSH